MTVVYVLGRAGQFRDTVKDIVAGTLLIMSVVLLHFFVMWPSEHVLCHAHRQRLCFDKDGMVLSTPDQYRPKSVNSLCQPCLPSKTTLPNEHLDFVSISLILWQNTATGLSWPRLSRLQPINSTGEPIQQLQMWVRLPRFEMPAPLW